MEALPFPSTVEQWVDAGCSVFLQWSHADAFPLQHTFTYLKLLSGAFQAGSESCEADGEVFELACVHHCGV